VKINGISRLVATNSTADILIIGVAGTVITNGVIGPDATGHKWNLPASVTIPAGGAITITATCQDLGAITAAIGILNKIATPVYGWQSANNPAAASVGNPVESDAELRIRQGLATTLRALTVMEAIVAAVAAIAGVSRSIGYENDSNITDSDGVSAHSISMVVEGGDSQVIGDTIASKKTPGTGTYGTTPISTYDSRGVLNVINFFRPIVATIGVEVTITALSGYTSGYAGQIKTAVADTLNNLAIGDDVLITKLYVPANLPNLAAGATFDISLIRIKKNAGAFDTTNVVLVFNEVAECTPTVDVTVIVL
jgi:uncharacterized phage protein gp47/JayE